MRHAFTVDVEEWFHAIGFYRESVDSDVSRLRIGLGRLLDLLDANAVKATFFWVADVAAAYPGVVRALVDSGHEIGCHGLRHVEMVYEQTPSAFRRETMAALALIGDIAGREIQAYRAPCFSITRRALWAFDILEELGIRYDSSVFPVRNWRYGIPTFPLEPVRVGSGGSLWEIPLSARRIGGINVPVSGGAYFRLYPYPLTAANFRATAACGRFVVFYIHPWELDPDHPFVLVDWRATLTHYANLRRTQMRLRRLLSDFSFGPLGEVTEQYVSTCRTNV